MEPVEPVHPVENFFFAGSLLKSPYTSFFQLCNTIFIYNVKYSSMLMEDIKNLHTLQFNQLCKGKFKVHLDSDKDNRAWLFLLRMDAEKTQDMTVMDKFRLKNPWQSELVFNRWLHMLRRYEGI